MRACEANAIRLRLNAGMTGTRCALMYLEGRHKALAQHHVSDPLVSFQHRFPPSQRSCHHRDEGGQLVATVPDRLIGSPLKSAGPVKGVPRATQSRRAFAQLTDKKFKELSGQKLEATQDGVPIFNAGETQQAEALGTHASCGATNFSTGAPRAVVDGRRQMTP